MIDAGPALEPTVVITATGARVVAGRKLQFRLEPDAATAGDVWLFDPGTRTVLAGDLVTLPAPFLDTACPARWQQLLIHLENQRFRLLISGHGAPLHPQQLRTYRVAFDHLIACGSSSRARSECIDGWLHDSGDLVAAGEQRYARALLDYYHNVLRNNPAALARDCA